MTRGIDSIVVLAAANVFIADSLVLAATIYGLNPDRRVLWSAQFGSVDPSGRYLAPDSAISDLITAQSVADTGVRAHAVINVVAYQIVYSSWVSGNEDIYRADVIDGVIASVRRLTSDAGQDLEPTWAPQGHEVAFTSHRTGGTAVWRMNSDGTNQRDVTSSLVERARWPNWCRNGFLAMAFIDSVSAGIAILDTTGLFTRVYTEPPTARIPERPLWSPDCAHIAFTTYRDGNWEVYRITADGSALTNITQSPQTEDAATAWFADGQAVVFVSRVGGGENAIWRINTDGSTLAQLIDLPGTEIDADLSQDSRLLLFARWYPLDVPSQLDLLRLDTQSPAVRLTTAAQHGTPRYPRFRRR